LFSQVLTVVKIIKTLVEIEYNLLKYYKQFYNVYKNVIYNINNQLVNGKIKLYREEIPSHKTKIILKISGIWENVNEIGITYKFLEMYESNNCQTISI
jgi:hypothetical protein